MPAWTREPLDLPTFPVAHDRIADVLSSAATRTLRWATASERALAAQLHQQADAVAS